MRKIPKTFTLSPSSIEKLAKVAMSEDRTASKIVDTLIDKKIINACHCTHCNKKLTDDELHMYKDICYKCCSIAWRKYEMAHGGVCKTDIAKRHVTKSMKREIIMRDGGECLNCGSTVNLTVDHITPLSKGGDNDYSNLQTLCSCCNSRKSDTIADHREVI